MSCSNEHVPMEDDAVAVAVTVAAVGETVCEACFTPLTP
jgi:hypothetical protein